MGLSIWCPLNRLGSDGILHRREVPVCPACFTTAALAAASLTSAGSLTAWALGKPPGRSNSPFMAWLRYHDRYGDAA